MYGIKGRRLAGLNRKGYFGVLGLERAESDGKVSETLATCIMYSTLKVYELKKLKKLCFGMNDHQPVSCGFI